MKLAMGKERPVENPYLIIEDKVNGWVYRVLKAYSKDPNKQFARVLANVKSPLNALSANGDLGDTYWANITGEITFRDPVVEDSDIPTHLFTGAVPADPLAALFGD